MNSPNTFQHLLRYPSGLDLEERWKKLTVGNDLFAALLDAVRRNGVDEAEKLLASWQQRFTDRGGRGQWQVADALCTCARLAAVTGETVGRLPALLRRLDSAASVPDWTQFQPASIETFTGETSTGSLLTVSPGWPRFLRESMAKLQWPSPLSPSCGTTWLWDAVTALADNGRPVARRESTTVLLVGDEGFATGLTLEWLAGDGQGDFYPDPATMAFVGVDAKFEQAITNAVACVRAMGLWRVERRADVRWRLVRRDGHPLDTVTGLSAGAAYALTLAKLAAGGA